MLPIDRRDFLKLSTAAAVGAAGMQQKDVKTLPVVNLGKTGRVVPRMGLGCFPVGNLTSADEAQKILRRAFDLGIRYIDTAPSYSSGTSERRVGEALKSYNRKEFFITTKTLERGASGARRELEQSLKRLSLDYVDCIQVHEIHDDFELLAKKESVLAGLEKAREEGLVKFIGITCHRDPAYLIKAFERYEFATALIPVNPIDTKHLSFTRELLPVATKKGIATIAMKIFAGGKLLTDGKVSSLECLRFAHAQKDATVLVPGCDSVKHVEEAYAVALETESRTAAWLAEIEQKAGKHRGKDSEWYKNTKRE
ncbi:MAG: aldo/keto reductase [Planctomycetota bacterium]